MTSLTPPDAPELAALIARADAGDAEAALLVSAELARAGQHQPSLGYLIRAANAGHVVAQATLGLRLVVGRLAPHDPQKGIQLVRAAAQAGSPDALAYYAALSASGVFGPPDWAAALLALARAAERDHASAQEQLQLLWPAGLATSKAIAEFITEGGPEVISAAPRIATLDELVPEAFCAHWIAHAAPRLASAQVYDQQKGGARAHDRRSNTSAGFGLLDTDVVMHMTRARIAAAIGYPLAHQEPPNVLHYATGETFAPHHDYIDPANAAFADTLERQGQRAATALIYLNDAFEGGETHFLSLAKRVRQKTGGLLVFDNVDVGGAVDPQTLHEGAAPTQGEKWLLSVWIRDRPQPVA